MNPKTIFVREKQRPCGHEISNELRLKERHCITSHLPIWSGFSSLWKEGLDLIKFEKKLPDNDRTKSHTENSTKFRNRHRKTSMLSDLEIDNIQKSFVSDYRILDGIIGKGSSAKIYKCTHKKTGALRAAKAIKKGSGLYDSVAVRAEIEILTSLRHPNIVHLYHAYEDDPDCVFIVTSLYSGGTLMSGLFEQGNFSEQAATSIMLQIFSAVAHCHKNGVVHRDIKTENIMFTSSRSMQLVLIDFGFAKKRSFLDQEIMLMHSIVGTPNYMAPEIILKKSYSEKCDSWSIGVVFYTILCGFHPFHGSNVDQICQSIVNDEVKFEDAEWCDVSENTKFFLEELLRKNPEERLPVDELGISRLKQRNAGLK